MRGDMRDVSPRPEREKKKNRNEEKKRLMQENDEFLNVKGLF